MVISSCLEGERKGRLCQRDGESTTQPFVGTERGDSYGWGVHWGRRARAAINGDAALAVRGQASFRHGRSSWSGEGARRGVGEGCWGCRWR